MDLQHFTEFAPLPVVSSRPPRASSGDPLIDLDRPFVSEPDEQGRFFIISRRAYGWRCDLYSKSNGYESHRVYGDTDQDYLLAFSFGEEWAK